MNRIPSPYASNSENVSRETSREEDPPRELPREEIRGLVLRDDGRERMRIGAAAVDPFDVADIYKIYAPTGGHGTPVQIAKEIDFNWKVYELAGKRDYAQERAEHDQGWEPVHYEDFPGRFAPVGTSGSVIVKDMILMWRPMRLTVQARNEDIALANRSMQVNRLRMSDVPEGQAPRMEPTVRTSRETIEIPE